MKRREFLKWAAGTALMSTSWRLWAAPDGGSGSRLMFVFLRGAYDALSVLVPYDSPFYYEARPHIALAGPKSGKPGAALRLDDRWALHPTLEDTLLPFYADGQLAFVPFSGTGFVSRSHFQAQDWIEFGQAPGGRPDPGSGFLNRLIESLGGTAAGASFTSDLPPALRGRIPVVNSPVRPGGRHTAHAGYESLVQAMYSGHPYETLVRDGMGLRREIEDDLQDERRLASRDAMPAGGFALEAARIGRLLREHPEYTIGFVDVGGWDTHAGQGAALGLLSNQLNGLGEGLDRFAEALGPAWKQTVVVVISEFGRTFRENGAKGTDHGHGSALWLLGGSVRGGRIAGEQAELRGPEDLHQQRDLPVLNEYRNVLGSVFQRMYGLDAAALDRVFPGAVPQDLGLV